MSEIHPEVFWMNVEVQISEGPHYLYVNLLVTNKSGVDTHCTPFSKKLIEQSDWDRASIISRAITRYMRGVTTNE